MTTSRRGSVSSEVDKLQGQTEEGKVPMADATEAQVKVAESAMAGLVSVLVESGFSVKNKPNKSGGLYWGVYPKGRITLPDGSQVTMSITFNTAGKAATTPASIGKLVLPS